MRNYYTEGAAEYCLGLFPEHFKGVCVDIGACEPKWLNNSWIFEELGWDCYCIEANPKYIPELAQHRKNVLPYAVGNQHLNGVDFFVFTLNEEIGEAAGSGLLDFRIGEGEEEHKAIYTRTEKVHVRTLDWIMNTQIKKPHIDFLSIDVERNEMEVLRGAKLEVWKPKVICIENLEVGNEQEKFLSFYGYEKIKRIEYNDIYLGGD